MINDLRRSNIGRADERVPQPRQGKEHPSILRFRNEHCLGERKDSLRKDEMRPAAGADLVRHGRTSQLLDKITAHPRGVNKNFRLRPQNAPRQFVAQNYLLQAPMLFFKSMHRHVVRQESPRLRGGLRNRNAQTSIIKLPIVVRQPRAQAIVA